MLRPHQLFESPLPVDLKKSVQIAVPDAWQREISDAKISVLPLVGNPKEQYSAGWCTYTYEHVQTPELEIICGGINAKTPKAMGIWRQGHLMHFGFEQSPSELNDSGQALLVNSICYIWRFTDDRPIIRPPSAFYSSVRFVDRGAIDRAIGNDSRNLDWILGYLSDEVAEAVRGKSRLELADWYRTSRGFLRADKRGRFEVDSEAQRFGIATDGPEFIPAAIHALHDSGEGSDLARRLLKRYAPNGPDADSYQTWHQWWETNQDYLFFADTGGFVWHIDPLAKKRGIPTKDLRGPARGSRKAIQLAN